MDRRFLIVTAVVGFHLVALWALHAGLVRRAVELVIPVQILAELIEAPQPVAVPTPPAPPPPQPVPRQQPPKPSPQQAPRPAPAPAPAPVVPSTSAPPLAAPITLPPVTPPAPTTATAPPAAKLAAPAPAPALAPFALPSSPQIDLPSSSADYLNNPPPPYPPLSKRMGEQGQVVVRARIEANGTASQAEIRTSSGFQRLDQAALQTVKRWRYVPGKRAGVPEAMWFNIPIRFVLD